MPFKHAEKQWEDLLSAVSAGLSEADACDLTGIGVTTLHDRKEKDSTFTERLKRANASFELVHLNNIHKAATGTLPDKAQWTASAWLLERKFPGKYGSQARMDITSGGRSLVEPSWFGSALDVHAEDITDSILELPEHGEE